MCPVIVYTLLQAVSKSPLSTSHTYAAPTSLREKGNHNQVTPQIRGLFEKLHGSHLVTKFPAIYGTRRFITAFTTFRHLWLSWAISIQSMSPHPTSWRSTLILSSYLRLGLPSGLFPSNFPTIILHTPFQSPTRATCPAHLILHLTTRTISGEQYRSLSSSLCSSAHSQLPCPS